MHRWLGFRKEGNLCYCPGCNVTLCRMCYDDYHKVSDLTGIKHWLKQECLHRGDQQEAKYRKRQQISEKKDGLKQECLKIGDHQQEEISSSSSIGRGNTSDSSSPPSPVVIVRKRKCTAIYKNMVN